jgi:Ca2+-binding RTX toxin-like protein
MSGTSMAAPHVSGLAALIKSIHPEYTNDDIADTIVNNATTLGIPQYVDAGLMDALAAVSDLPPTPPPVDPPAITNIPDVDEGEDIIIYGSNIDVALTQVIIKGGAINEYATITSISTTEITIENKPEYAAGTYEIQLETNGLYSGWVSFDIIYIPPSDPPFVALIPDVEEGTSIEILGDSFDLASLSVHITGNGYDEDCSILFSCGTAIKVDNIYLAGSYNITVYNGATPSSTIPFTIYSIGSLPALTYTTINGNNSFNWINGNHLNNIINAFGGSDYIFGREGHDILYGGDGDDSYVYGLGHGIDYIEDSSGGDILILMGIDPDDVTSIREGDDEIVYVPNGKITIVGHYTGTSVETLGYW